MTTLRFEGIIELGDEYRVADESGEKNGSVWIGGEDLIERVGAAFEGGSQVTVGIFDECYAGGLHCDTGWGYSEYTPMDSDKLWVGPHNLIEIFERWPGGFVTVVISDGPIDVGMVGPAQEETP